MSLSCHVSAGTGKVFEDSGECITVKYSTVLYCTVLYCTVLYCGIDTSVDFIQEYHCNSSTEHEHEHEHEVLCHFRNPIPKGCIFFFSTALTGIMSIAYKQLTTITSLSITAKHTQPSETAVGCFYKMAKPG